MSLPLFFSLPGNEEACERIALFSEGEVGKIESRCFPDGESYVRVATDVSGRETVVVCTLNEPDAKVVPLLFLADALHELGAQQVGLVAPYLATCARTPASARARQSHRVRSPTSCRSASTG